MFLLKFYHEFTNSIEQSNFTKITAGPGLNLIRQEDKSEVDILIFYVLFDVRFETYWRGNSFILDINFLDKEKYQTLSL